MAKNPVPPSSRKGRPKGTSKAAKPQELPKVFSPEEIERLFAVPNLDAPTGLRNRAHLQLLLGCGLRVTESCLLHLRDVDWREGEIHLRAEITKGKKEAVVYLDPTTLAWLERWKGVRRKYAAGSPFLFTTLQGGRVDRRYVWSMIRRYARRAGIDRATPHMLRHTFGTELLREDFNLREVQELMRHADIRTTQIYTHLHDAELRRRIKDRGR